MGLKEKHRLHLTIALVVVAIILIIAGAVMLGIGISKSNEKNTEVKLECQADQLNSFYISAWSANLNWPDCCNSDQNMINAKKNLTDQITSILKSPSSSSFLARHTFLSEITGSDHFLNEAALGSSVNIVKLTIDTITPAPMSSPGAVFYATLVTLGSPAPDATAIQNDLINGGFPSNVSGDPTQQCTGLKIPPGIPNLSTTTTPTTTTTAATVTTTGINDFPYPCGLPTISRAVLFLVDAASPTESPNFSMAFKLAYVQSYLTAMTPPAGSWNGLLMGVAVYYDTSAYIPDNFLCSTADCWTSMLGNVPRLQLPAQTVSHNVSRGLMFVYDEFSTMKQIPTGSSRTVILISDGFEFVDQGPIAPVTWAKNLMDTGFTVAAIVPTPINSVRQQMRALVSTRWYNYYEADSLSLLDNTAIVQYSAGWVCNALPYNPITTPASTTTNTQPPLILPTTTTTSGPPLTTPFPPKCANLSILFLIDESQSMLISNGWENAKNFVINVTQLFQQIPNAQFAWVTFNSKVWISTPFSDPTTFLTNVAASVFNTGATNFELGFNETLKTLQSVRTDRKPVLIFVSDGAPNIGGSVTTITQQMRCQLNTQIIGLGINEDAAGAAAIKSSIGVDDSTPGCVSASYNNIAGYENLVGQGLTAVLDELKCTNPPCSLNIVFAVEVSELVNVNGYITEQAAVITVTNQLIADNKISYYGDRIGLVYFSSPQNFNGNEMDKSGTLNSGYLTYNGEDFINKTKNLTTTLGGASDILLGLNLTYQMLMRSDAMTNGNLPTIVVMGRGKFKDADNCCDPPYDIANQILALPGATMQGVVLGPLNDPVIMAGITRRPNFYPKAGYDTSASNANDAGQALGTQIIAYLNAARNNGSCPPVNRESFCQQYMDIIIIMKSFNTPVNNSIATNFITKLLLKEFGGANIGPLNDRLTRIGFVHYHENADPELFPLDMYTSIDDIASAIMGIASHLYTPSGQTNMLSTAYNRAGDLLSSKARNQATSTIILITDQLDASDATAASAAMNTLKTNYQTLFIGISSSTSVDFTNIVDNSLPANNIQGLNPDANNNNPAVQIANQVRDWACGNSKTMSTPTLPTVNPCIVTTQTPPTTPTTTPSFWPDITILLDTSADLSAGSNALNDRGFETMRIFLANMFDKYNIGPTFTRVALITYDGNATTVFRLIDYPSKQALYQAIGNDWTYGPAITHSNAKNLEVGLKKALDTIYTPNGGFNQGRLNYLWIFTTGPPSSSSNYQDLLRQIGRLGVRIQAIGLQNTPTSSIDWSSYLANFGFNGLSATSYNDPMYGINNVQRNELFETLFQSSTRSGPLPQLPQVVSDIVVAIDETAWLLRADFDNNIKPFLVRFVSQLNIAPYGSSVAVVPFSDQPLASGGWSLNDNQNTVISSANSLQYVGNGAVTANYTAVLDYISNTVLQPQNGFKNRSTIVIFITSAPPTNVTGASAPGSLFVNFASSPSASNLQSRANVMGLALGQSASVSYLNDLTGSENNVGRIGDPAGLLQWSSGPNNSSLLQQFFQQLATIQQTYDKTHQVSLPYLAADFVFAVDTTNLSASDFQSIKSYLVNFTSLVNIDRAYAQIGVTLYNADSVRVDGFSLNRGTSSANSPNVETVNAINALAYPQRSSQSTTVDLVGVLNQLNSTYLRASQGWRQGPTYIILMASAPAYNSTAYTQDQINALINTLRGKAFTYGFALNGNGAQRYVPNFSLAFSFLSFPTSLTIDSTASNIMIQQFESDYNKRVNPTQPPPQTIVADFVFAIDTSMALGGFSDFAHVKTFLVNMTNSLTIGRAAAQISVVMFNSNSVNSTIWLNTFNNQALLASAIGALQYVPSSVNTTDVPGVINYLMNTILNPVNGYRQKLTFVTFINVAASSTTSIDLAQSQINQLKALSAQLFAFQYTATSGNLMPFIPVTNRADVSRTGFAWSSAGVQNYLSFVQDKWAAYQQNIPTGPPLPIPLTNVYADIVFVIDGTSALTQDAFNTVISYIITLSDSFYIDPKSTQFSVMFFASGPTPLSGTILLNSARTNAELQNRIRQIPYPNSQVSNWNLISALNYTTGLLLTPAQGWRNQGGIITIVVFIGIADSETTNSCDILNNQGQVPLSQKAQGIFAIALNSKQSTSNYLHCVIPQTHNFARADPPTSLVQYSDADNSLRTYMSNAYQNFVNSGTGGLPPIDPKLIATDIVFVVDQTFYVSASSFGFLQDFMVNFLSQFTIDPSRVLASVVTFDSAAKDSFPLWRANTTLGLQNAIYGLKSAGSTAYEFNVQSAINYLLQYILTPAQGHAPGKSATVIFLAASPAASMTTYDQIEQLNSIASVYGIDFIDNGAANNYLLRLVNFNPYSVFRTQFPSYLVSTESEGSKRVTLFTSNAYNYYLNNPPVPIASVHSDIAIIIDNTQSLTPTIFAYIKTWLMSYVQKYSVTPTLTQFAVVFYDNGVKNTVIYLNSVENSYQLNNTLSNLQFTASTQTAFDLAGALSYVATNIFQSSAGYRGRATSLIIVGIAPTAASDCPSINRIASQFWAPSTYTLYGIAMGSAGSDPSTYLRCALNNQAYLSLATPFASLSGTVSESQLSFAVSYGYQTHINTLNYTMPYPLSTKMVDLVFLIDQSPLSRSAWPNITQFIANFVGQFTISPQMTQVAVIGVNEFVHPRFNLNTYNNSNDLKSAILNLPPGMGTLLEPDISSALQYIATTTLSYTNGRRPNVPAVVVPMIVSQFLNPVDSNAIALINGLARTFGINLYGYQETNDQLLRIVKDNDFALGRVGNPSLLLDPNTLAVRQLSSFISNIPPSLPTPLLGVNADIVFLIDGSSALTQAAFNSTIAYISSFATEFLIDVRHTQIAVIVYDNSPRASILLNSASDQQSLQARLRGLTWPNSAVTSWDLAGAISYVSSTILRRSQGWRERISTNVIFVGISDSISTDCSVINSPLPQNVTRFAVALNSLNSTQQYLQNCAVANAPNSFTRADPPSSLVRRSTADWDITYFVSQSYANYIAGIPHPIVWPLNQTQLNLVFVIDQTIFLSPQAFTYLKSAMVGYVSQFSIKPGFVSVSVISVDQNILGAASFPLTRATNLNDLTGWINNLTYVGSTVTSFNLSAAVNYLNQVILRPAQGYDSSKSSAIIFFASSPLVTRADLYQVVELNSRGMVFGMDILGNAIAKTYLDELTLANDYNVFRVPNPSFLVPGTEGFQRLSSFASIAYVEWITNPPVPPILAYSDIVIVLDGSSAMTQSAFNSMVQGWLPSFVRDFAVAPFLTQFSIMTYDWLPVGNPIFFNSSTSRDQLSALIGNITYTQSPLTSFDITTALDYVGSTLLTTANGWRGQSTFVIVVTFNGNTRTSCDIITRAASNLWPKAAIYGLAVPPTPGVDPTTYLTCALPTQKKSYITLSDPVTYATASSPPPSPNFLVQAPLFYAIGKEYQNYIDGQNYTLTVPLSTKVIDIVFVVDKSFYTVQGFGLIIQFMSSYVANFNIGPLGAQVAILGVSDTIDQYLNFNDTNNLSDLQSRINNFQPGNVDVTVNLAQALPILLQTTFHPSNGRRQDVPAMVIILLGSDKLSQPTPDSFEYVADLWRMTDVFGINLYGYARTSEVLEFLARNARNVGVVANISTLLTPGNTAVQKLSYAVSNSMPQRPLPTYLVASDIVILIDGTSSMTQDAFTYTKTWLLSFVNQFFIDRAVAQISVLIYDSSPRAGSIVLNGATDNPGLTTRISNIPWPNSTVTNFDLLGAINYTTTRLLTRAQGWRNQSTIVIIVGISPTITTSCNDLRGNNTLRGVAEVLTLALNAQRSTADYLNCIEPFPGLGFTAAIPYSMLIPGGIADTVITNDVTRAYQYGYVDRQPRYPPIPLNLVQLDVVFVVDSTAYTTPAIFSLLQDMMVKFASQFTIGKGQTMFSVISYDQSNWGAGSFPLTRATDLNSLQRSIYALQVRNSSTIYQIDIAGAMDYVSNLILTPNQGHTNGRAAAVIILANTPNYVSLPNSNQIARLNSMGGVFGVDIPGQGASTYLLYAANFNDRNVLRAYGAGNLNFQRNFDQLTYFASSVYYSWLTNPPVPTVATLADIVIVMDSSQAVSQSFFNPLKQWLTTYVAQYSVGSSLTQFAIVFYDNAPRYNVINFNSATNGVQIQNALNGITFSASSQTNWDIRGAINYVASSVLTTQNGFRGQSAVVILASASASPTFSSSDCSAITAASLILARNATVLGLSLNPASTPNSYQSLVCAVGTANSASVYGAQMGATLAGTTAELQLSYAISLNYQKYVDSLPYDVPYPLISKSVDLVFLIDQSFYTYRSFDQLKQWLASYVDNFTLSNGAGGTQIAVVGVGRLSTAPRNVTQYIALNRTSDPSTLKSLIQFIEHDEETVITPDIDGALQFIEQTSLQPQSGRRPNVPAVTIILLGSGLLDPVQPSTAAILQGMSNVFGMNLYGYPAATNLLLQLTNGNDAAVGRMGNISTLLMPNNLPVRMLNSFISNSQLSWTQLAAADFVFVIDQTRMSSDDFISVKAYLTQLISQFQIGTNYSQFAVVQFAKTPFVIGNNIALNGATSNAVLVNRINSLPYIGGGPTATDAADLNGALAAVNNTYLMPSQGWRQNQGTSTFVVIIATASSATNAANAPSTVVSDLQAKDSYIYGFDAANLALRDSYLRNYYTPNVITLSSASSLTVSSSANKNFLDFVQSNTNAGLKQPCQRYMDVVIVLHSFSSQTNYDISIRFVTQLLLAVLPTDITGPQGDRYARVAFVVYHEDDVHLVFGLNSYTSIAQMTYAIQSETYHAPAAATTQKISLAYNAANAELLTNARSYATRNIILVTDRIDDDDRMDALTANQNARATGTITMGVGAGHMSGLGFSGIVSGGFVSAPDVPSMDPVGLYPQEAVYVVDFARDAVCQNSFIPTMTTTTTAGPTTPQFLLNMDLVIAIDVSTTMPTSNFNDVTTFITSLVIPAYFGSIGQGNPGVRIALVVVPGTSGVVFPAAKLNTIGNKAALLGALNSLNDFCDGSPGQALNRFFNDVTGPDFMNNGYRTNINNHLILYITGTSTFDGGNAAAISSAQNIRSQNTYGIITIAYTPGQPDADPNVLNSIAGGPNCVLVAKTVDDLNRNGIPFVQQILLSASTTGKYC